MTENSVKLRVRSLPNSTHEIEISKDEKVEALKRKLEEIANIPIDRQRLIYRGRVLDNKSIISELGIESGHTLHLVERQDEQSNLSQTHSGPSNTTRISMNVGSNSGAGLQDFERIMDAVFSAVNLDSQPRNISFQRAVSTISQAMPHTIISSSNLTIPHQTSNNSYSIHQPQHSNMQQNNQQHQQAYALPFMTHPHVYANTTQMHMPSFALQRQSSTH